LCRRPEPCKTELTDEASISRLENSPHANPTVETILRVAEALRVDLRIAMVDRDAGELIDIDRAA